MADWTQADQGNLGALLEEQMALDAKAVARVEQGFTVDLLSPDDLDRYYELRGKIAAEVSRFEEWAGVE